MFPDFLAKSMDDKVDSILIFYGKDEAIASSRSAKLSLKRVNKEAASLAMSKNRIYLQAPLNLTNSWCIPSLFSLSRNQSIETISLLVCSSLCAGLFL